MQLFMFPKLFFSAHSLSYLWQTAMLCFKPGKYGRQDAWHVKYGMMNMAWKMHTIYSILVHVSSFCFTSFATTLQDAFACRMHAINKLVDVVMLLMW